MISPRTLLAPFAAAVLACPPFAALAQSGGNADAGPPAGGKPHGPPPEATAACQGKAVGATASFTDRGGRTISGACTQMGDVVAVPPPRGQGKAHGGTPPPDGQ